MQLLSPPLTIAESFHVLIYRRYYLHCLLVLMSLHKDDRELNASAAEYRPRYSVEEEQSNEISDKELYKESYERCSADLEMLSAAYPEEISILNTTQYEQEEEEIHIPDWFPLVFSLMLPDLSKKNLSKKNQTHGANIIMEFPMGYPTEKSLQIVSYRGASSSKKDHVEAAVAAIRGTATESLEVYGGEECALACCAAAIETWNDCHEEDLAAIIIAEKMKEEEEAKNEKPSDDDIHWFTAEDTLLDRKSVFQSHICKVSDENMVRRAVNKLIDGNSKIQRATHNMVSF